MTTLASAIILEDSGIVDAIRVARGEDKMRWSIYFLLSTIVSSPARAADWYETEGFSCSGHLSLQQAVQAITGEHLSVKKGEGGPDSFYVDWRIGDGLPVDKIAFSKFLDKENSTVFKKIFSEAASDAKVPGWFSFVNGITTKIFLPNGIGRAVNIVFSQSLFENAYG